MNNEKVICCDLDDTISNTAETLLKYAVEYSQTVLKKEVIINFQVESEDYYYFSKMLGWGKDEIIGFFQHCYPEYLKYVKCKPFVASTLRQLKHEGFSIHIVTARREANFEDVYLLTTQWLKKNNVTFDKLVLGKPNKSEYVLSCNAVAFIDDSYKNCIEVGVNTNAKIYIMDAWYNKKYANSNIQRVMDWNELAKYLIELK